MKKQMRMPVKFFITRGFSLVELMIAITIGFVILLGLSVVFYTSTVSRKEIDRSARQIENGRYAMQVLSDDLKLAGYVAEFNPNVLPLPGAKPNPCLTTVADLNAQLPLHVCGGPASTLPWLGDDDPVTDAITMLVPAYRLIESTARKLGFDPDRPPGLSKITETL